MSGQPAHVHLVSTRHHRPVPRPLKLPVRSRRRFDLVDGVVAAVIVAGLLASLLFALALVLGAAWLVLSIARELMRGFS
jgi:hypothetical protein